MAKKFLDLSVDNTLGGASPSDTKAVSEKAIKEYADTKVSDVTVNSSSVVSSGTAVIPNASGDVYGVTKLSNSLVSTSNTSALTPNAINTFAREIVTGASLFDKTATYAVGDRVRYSSGYYECNTAITTGHAWNANEWTQITIQGQIDAKLDDVTVNGSSVVNNGVANITNMVTTDTAQDVTNTKTFKAQQKIQSGDASGALVIGADVGETTLTDNTRKLGRVTLPPKASANPNVAIISADTQAFNSFSVLPTGYSRTDTNTVSFGSAPGDTTSTAPDVLGFTIAKTHNATATADKTLAIEISKEQVKFNIQPNYNGNNLLIASDIPVNDVTVDGTSIVSSGVATIPIAETSGDYGLVKLSSDSSGIMISTSGALQTRRATDSDISARTNINRPIVPSNLDLAVKTSITDNSITLTATEKTNACSWLGASQGIIKRVWAET